MEKLSKTQQQVLERLGEDWKTLREIKGGCAPDYTERIPTAERTIYSLMRKGLVIQKMHPSYGTLSGIMKYKRS